MVILKCQTGQSPISACPSNRHFTGILTFLGDIARDSAKTYTSQRSCKIKKLVLTNKANFHLRGLQLNGFNYENLGPIEFDCYQKIIELGHRREREEKKKLVENIQSKKS